MKKELKIPPMAEPIEPILTDITDEEMEELTNELMLISDEGRTTLNDWSKEIMETVVDLKELMMMYSCAMKDVRAKLEILNIEYNVKHKRNPIHSINTRLKRLTGIMEKMGRKGITFSIDNVENNIHDVAGVRVICSYVDDIYAIAKALENQEGVEIIEEKDYIKNPKPNGYRSLHLIMSVPISFTNQVKRMRVEVQIRTIAMDFWATLEHQMKYRKHLPDGEEIISNLKGCAEIIATTDSRMLAIRRQIEESASDPTEEDILLEKIRKIDEPIE